VDDVFVWRSYNTTANLNEKMSSLQQSAAMTNSPSKSRNKNTVQKPKAFVPEQTQSNIQHDPHHDHPQYSTPENPFLGKCRSVEEFEKLNKIGEGTYGTVCTLLLFV
jgi:hypothetical protein